MLKSVEIALIIILFWPLQIFSQTKEMFIGDVVPEITIKNPEGNEISLSSLRGKVVLIEFWASWDRNSRQNHPYLVKCYNKYNKKKFIFGDGFSCFSVSLDKYQSAWLTAINLDGLVWNSHGCNFKYWSCQNAINYGVQKLPSYFLIDGTGKLILSLESLENLDELIASYLLQ